MTKRLQSLFYWFNVSWVRLLMIRAAKRDIKGKENVPRSGPVIIASSHQNNADPPVVADATPREVKWLTKAEWFKTPFVGLMFRMAGMIPVKRFEADLHALREAQKLLDGGGCLGMFPEGTRGKGLGLRQGEPGSALIALRTGAPVVPVGVWGTEHVKLPLDLIKRTHVHVRFGKPILLEPAGKKITRQDVTRGTETIMRAIAELLPEKFRGVYATPPAAADAKLVAESKPSG